jgi:hypothetical protein
MKTAWRFLSGVILVSLPLVASCGAPVATVVPAAPVRTATMPAGIGGTAISLPTVSSNVQATETRAAELATLTAVAERPTLPPQPASTLSTLAPTPLPPTPIPPTPAPSPTPIQPTATSTAVSPTATPVVSVVTAIPAPATLSVGVCEGIEDGYLERTRELSASAGTFIHIQFHRGQGERTTLLPAGVYGIPQGVGGRYWKLGPGCTAERAIEGHVRRSIEQTRSEPGRNLLQPYYVDWTWARDQGFIIVRVQADPVPKIPTP